MQNNAKKMKGTKKENFDSWNQNSSTMTSNMKKTSIQNNDGKKPRKEKK